MVYTDLYWGQVAQGLNIRIGRYTSLPDIEAQLPLLLLRGAVSRHASRR